jgi:type II secretory pathway component PulC
MEKEGKIGMVIKVVMILAVIGAVILSYKLFENKIDTKQVLLETKMKALRVNK